MLYPGEQKKKKRKKVKNLKHQMQDLDQNGEPYYKCKCETQEIRDGEDLETTMRYKQERSCQ